MEIKCGHCKLFETKKCPLLGKVHRENKTCGPYRLYGCERDKVNKLLCEVESLKTDIEDSISGKHYRGNALWVKQNISQKGDEL